MNTKRMSRRARTALVLLVASTLLSLGAGCQSEFNETWNASLDIVGPFESNGDFIYVNRTLGEVLRVDGVKEEGKPKIELDRIKTGSEPGSVKLSPDGQTLFVVNREDETLSVIDLGQDELSSTTLELNAAYEVLTLDPQGEFLLLSFSGVTQEGIIARNVNQIGIVDLTQSELSARFVTLASRARALIFADPFELGGEEQRLVAALSDSEVTLIDLLVGSEDPENQLREIPLTISEADAIRTPTKAVFDVTPSEDLPDTINLYVLTQGDDDVTQISVQPSVREDALFKFNISVNQLAAGSRPTHMALLELPERGTRLLTTSGTSAQFTLVDVASGESSSFTLPMATAAEGIELYTATEAAGDELSQELRVLAWSSRSEVVAVIRPETIAISADQPTLGRSVQAIRLERAPVRVELDEAAARERAVVFHAGLTGGFTVLDLRDNRDIPIQGYSLSDITFDGQLAFGVFTGTENFGVFDLETGQPTVFELPEIGQQITVDTEDGLILVQHEVRTGHFTVLDATEPTPENAIVVRDLFLYNIFDQELPDAN
jgi:WD40 repeat protein